MKEKSSFIIAFCLFVCSMAAAPTRLMIGGGGDGHLRVSSSHTAVNKQSIYKGKRTRDMDMDDCCCCCLLV